MAKCENKERPWRSFQGCGTERFWPRKSCVFWRENANWSEHAHKPGKWLRPWVMCFDSWKINTGVLCRGASIVQALHSWIWRRTEQRKDCIDNKVWHMRHNSKILLFITGLYIIAQCQMCIAMIKRIYLIIWHWIHWQYAERGALFAKKCAWIIKARNFSYILKTCKHCSHKLINVLSSMFWAMTQCCRVEGLQQELIWKTLYNQLSQAYFTNATTVYQNK